jgi:ABC-type sugar transport system substrate-binding protein
MPRIRFVLVGAAAIAALTTACSSSGSSSSSPTASSSAHAATTIAYDGPEASLHLSFPTVPGKKLVIGFLNPSAVVPSLALCQKGVEAEVHALGGTVVAKDAQVNLNTQVSQFEELISQHVSAIIVFALDPSALAPQLQQAERAGIPAVAVNDPFDASQPLPAGYYANVLQGFDKEAYERAKYVASVSPGASYALMGFGGAPVPSLQYFIQRQRYWSDKFGLKFTEESDAQTNDANGGSQAMTAILAKSPNVQYVFSYDDPPALGAAGEARSAGKSVRVLGADASDQGTLDAVKAGVLFADYRSDQYELGAQAAIAAYSAAEKIKLSYTQIVVGGEIVTQANAGSINPNGPLK